MNPRFDWLQRSKYLHKVTGYDIQEEQEEIHHDKDRVSTYTSIFPLTVAKKVGNNAVVVPMTDEVQVEDRDGNKQTLVVPLYDAFFGYNVNPAALQKENTNERPSTDVVIPP